MSETYNGFTNRETWNANLFVQNEETYYKATRGKSAEQVEQFIKNRFHSSGGFGDMFTEEEMEKINFSEIQTV
jgi:hypothetical protein